MERNKTKMRKLQVTEMNRLGVEEFHVASKFPLVVVLDHVRSLYNVGSVFRTADAFRLSGLCLCGITATPPHVEIHKTALGAEESVDWNYFEKTEDAVTWLKNQGYRVMAVEQCEGSLRLQDVHPADGEELATVEIPQFGTKHSMNVSVTAGMVIWTIVARSLSDAPLAR